MKWRALLGKLASVTALRVGVAACGFSLFWLLSHHLSSAELGGFSVLMNTFFLLQGLPLLGLGVHLIREVAATPESATGELSHATALALPVSALLCLGLVAHAWFFADPSLRWPLTLLGVSMLPSAWVLVCESALIGLQRLQVLTAVTLLESVWRVAGAAASVWQGWDLTGVFAFFFVGRLMAACAYAKLAGLPSAEASAVTRKGLKTYLSLAPTYLGIALVTAVCSRIDMIALSQTRDLTEVGRYAAAAKLYEASLMVSTMALMIVYPALSRLFASDQPAFWAALDRCLRWALLLGAPLVFVGMAMAPWMIQVLYAKALWSATPVLQALLLAAWLMAMDQLLSATMLAAKAQREDFRSMAIGLLALLALLLPMSHWHGATGTAWAVVLALAVRVLARLAWLQSNARSSQLLSLSLRSAVATSASVSVFLFTSSSSGAASLSPAWQGLVAIVAAWAVHAAVAALIGAFGTQHRSDWAEWRARRNTGVVA